MRLILRRLLFVLGGLTVVGVGIVLFLSWPVRPVTPVRYGVTLSVPYARALGLDPHKVLIAALDDLGVRHFRLPAYWSEIQPATSTWAFADLDREVDAIAARQGSVIIAAGVKLPRWPECWIPKWASGLSADEFRRARLTYIETVVRRYRSHPALATWQVENEAGFPFGYCPAGYADDFADEVALVKHLDPKHQVTTTESGEWSIWLSHSAHVRELGVSTYRVVKHPWLGILNYRFIPASFYARKAQFSRFLGGPQVYVSEFQMEPWTTQDIDKTPLADQFQTLSIEQMKQNFTFATRMGIPAIDFWGVEWWYWMKEKQHDARFWDAAKEFFKTR